MLSMLEQIGLEAAMILAAAGSVVCLSFLVAATILERRDVRFAERAGQRLALRAGGRRRVVLRADLLYVSIVFACFVAVTAYAVLVIHT